MKMTRKWWWGEMSVHAALAGYLMMCASAMAAVTYTYENDNKTYVATVTGENTTMSSADATVLQNNEVTNFVLRGDKRLIVDHSVANGFTGDTLIDGASSSLLVLSGVNSLGVNQATGAFMLQRGGLAPANNTTIAKDIAFGFNHSDWNNRNIQVWENRSVRVNGKITTGNRNVDIVCYKNAILTIAGGLEDPLSGGNGFTYFNLVGGGKVKIENCPVNVNSQLYFRYSGTADNLDAQGFLGHVEFAVAGNKMNAIGWGPGDANFRLRRYKMATTVDWAFNKSDMDVYVANDGMWDLCGTLQRVGQFDVKVAEGNASIVTNSLTTPATLYMGRMHGPDNSAPDIRFGGNLSVVYEGDIKMTTIAHEMTARGGLVFNGSGTLAFAENGSWANATNVVVSGTGKITVANPNALGMRANVSLASNSSLEISSGVTVNVRTLTVNGVQQPRGDHTFGNGTLRVSHPCGFQLRVR